MFFWEDLLFMWNEKIGLAGDYVFPLEVIDGDVE